MSPPVPISGNKASENRFIRVVMGRGLRSKVESLRSSSKGLWNLATIFLEQTLQMSCYRLNSFKSSGLGKLLWSKGANGTF